MFNYCTTKCSCGMQACGCRRSEDISIHPRKMILTEMNNYMTNSDFTVSDVSAIRKSIYHARQKSLPSNPKFMSDVHKTLNIVGISKYIFTCYENLKFLCKSETIYIDGTFSYCPKYFTQFFVIYGFINEYYVPLVFCILNNKSTKTYECALLYVKNKAMQNFGLMLKPKYVTVDFELAIHLAVKSVWPLSEIIGCRVHLTQAWYRKIQALGLTSAYKDNKWLKFTFGLTFLDPNEVSDCFVEDFMHEIPDYPKYREYADYLVDNYIGEIQSSLQTFGLHLQLI
ncbi:uncharacterized protein LOC132929805 [Rhopalosiphum padi]|uniref:uncharacterized protein LOC132929805 n=1 Tax=Rhopalosiphum padi TaxID=40932 RepID=UPI00298E2E90|nr:uncharacterized protein LOC132929805 [Rhopalosiphum padi]